MKELKVRLTFTNEVLGTANARPDIHSEYIASKAPNAPSKEEEVEALGVEQVIENDMTIFPKLEDGTPFLWDYQIRGHFKECCGMLRRIDGTLSKKIKAYKKEIDGLILIAERKIPIDLDGQSFGNCQRSLRAQTAQGERIALANSETVPRGSKIEFTVQCIHDEDVELVKEWLTYGIFHGIGQWRNAGKGEYIFDVLDERKIPWEEAAVVKRKIEEQKLANEARA